ncbi:sensor domain-containing protein [Mycolicibacterium arenosum]|uniref:Sensor domain-containing protein n=1 Tax=Mycolicibacterium arenosum TaxID=2952157 RepID=A0ABT1LWP6_9MYCO|nr:sensor domain-containing protein [Mycolicibacterium sp. CAU 1645]MCP9271331.1 sensor domain-containing protein [Mycolicibacterium sp. CAU 1645]
MGKGAVIVALCAVLVGCTRVIDTPPPASGPPIAPIAAGQIEDLLSDDAQKGDDGNLFVTVEPEDCAGVAREVDPPFIFDAKPAAHSGGHWDAEVGGRVVYVEEIVAIYHADFDARARVADVRRTIESCRNTPLTITAMDGDSYVFAMSQAAESESPEVVLWSFTANSWACDNTYVAAHNAAIEITTCSEINGYDVSALAEDALKRIDALANTKL